MVQKPAHSELLQLLVKSLKSVSQAHRELVWIKNELPQSQWLKACEDRSKLYPLQYILGSQPFGDLNIKCRPNVLIPRNDTEEWCYELKDNLNKTSFKKELSILDMCSGSGCISLSLSCLPNVSKVVGMDKSPDAVSLSKENLELNKNLINPNCQVNFYENDIMDLRETGPGNDNFDLIVSNPPYIPMEEFNESHGVEKSVLLFEPKLALIGDLEFYKALIQNVVVPYRSNAFVFELGSESQALVTASELKKILTSSGNNLTYSWECGIKFDTSKNIRNVIGWNKDSDFDFKELCDDIISID